MENNTSITVRIPVELDKELSSVSKRIGMTKTNLLRISVHELPKKDSLSLKFDQESSPNPNKKRFVLNVNKLTYDILKKECEMHNQSMNAVITALSYAAIELAYKWLKLIEP